MFPLSFSHQAPIVTYGNLYHALVDRSGLQEDHTNGGERVRTANESFFHHSDVPPDHLADLPAIFPSPPASLPSLLPDPTFQPPDPKLCNSITNPIRLF